MHDIQETEVNNHLENSQTEKNICNLYHEQKAYSSQYIKVPENKE